MGHRKNLMASIRYIAYDTGKSRGAADRAPPDGRLPLPCRGPRGYCRRGRSPLRTTVKRCSLTFIDRSRNVGFIAYSESAGEIRNSPSTLRYLSAKPQIADIQIPSLVDRNLVLPALTELPVESVRHNLEPLSTTAFSNKRAAGRAAVAFQCGWPAFPADIVLVLYSCYHSFTAEVKL